ncbi:hypothetical protein CHS0354_029713 [Potamilus streckersoni]|uniref:Death domain-containing protein n=1 Tax=Potamilus streckersoni TaxID=2493646 RepID=A0AAE0VJV8_9BIVA|nr:hypothetical protein CHS0354_029713 [Potamilus streckersoni]
MPLQRGEMLPEHKRKILKNFISLKQDVDPKDIVDYFVEQELFDFEDVEKINNYNPNTQANRWQGFSKLLFSCGPKAYEVFLYALEQTKYNDLADAIRNTKVELSSMAEHQPDKLYWTKEVPKEVLTRRITERELSKLSSCLGSEWEMICLDLGVSQVEIDRCKMSNPYSVAMQIYSALNSWRNQQYKDATVDALLKIIAESPSTTVDWTQIEKNVRNF